MASARRLAGTAPPMKGMLAQLAQQMATGTTTHLTSINLTVTHTMAAGQRARQDGRDGVGGC